MNRPRIVFMGTPDFAVASLEALVNVGHQVVAVVTAPDKPAGRGMKVNESAVKRFALDKGIPVLQPEKLKNPEFLEQLRSFHADLHVVVAFRMLPELVWNMPPLGTINVHASLLPRYRGAAPINWAIINGDRETGVTTFKLTHEIDTGNILMQRAIAIDDDDNAGDVHDKLKKLGAEVLIETVDGLAHGTIKEIPQPETAGVTHAPKIFTETCRIDWNRPVRDIHNLVRGLSPYPGAFCEFEGKVLKIFKSKPLENNVQHPVGSWHIENKNSLYFAAKNGYLEVKELQLEGKKRMNADDFLRGYRR